MTDAADLREHLDWLLSFVPLHEPLCLLDAGCGEGRDLLELAARCRHGQTRLLGIDAATESVARAEQEALAARGAFFYSITGFAHVGRRTS